MIEKKKSLLMQEHRKVFCSVLPVNVDQGVRVHAYFKVAFYEISIQVEVYSCFEQVSRKRVKQVLMLLPNLWHHWRDTLSVELVDLYIERDLIAIVNISVVNLHFVGVIVMLALTQVIIHGVKLLNNISFTNSSERPKDLLTQKGTLQISIPRTIVWIGIKPHEHRVAKVIKIAEVFEGKLKEVVISYKSCMRVYFKHLLIFHFEELVLKDVFHFGNKVKEGLVNTSLHLNSKVKVNSI